jgi:hypothetical protein
MSGLRRVSWVLACAVLVAPALAQRRVHPRNLYERLVCVVEMTGSGLTADDPRRPMFAPLPPAPGEEPKRNGIIAFTYIESDDGRYALVEFVALDRSAFAEILPRRTAAPASKSSKEERRGGRTSRRSFASISSASIWTVSEWRRHETRPACPPSAVRRL